MRRREFIAGLSGAAASSLAARAQQPEKMARVGVLMAAQESDDPFRAALSIFDKALKELGWRHDDNLTVEYRWAGSDPNLMREYAKQLVSHQPHVLLGHTTPVVSSLMKETTTIPIIFVIVSDPLGSGFVNSFALPGRNATGFVNIEASLGGKWVELLKEAAPSTQRVVIIFNPQTAPHAHFYLSPFEAAAKQLGLESVREAINQVAEIEPLLAKHASVPGSALIVMPDIFVSQHRFPIISAAATHRIPVVYPYRYMVREGGFISYGIDNFDLYRRAANYVDQVLRGKKPAELPVQLPTKFEMSINLRTAAALGITLPQSLLARADEVIE